MHSRTTRRSLTFTAALIAAALVGGAAVWAITSGGTSGVGMMDGGAMGDMGMADRGRGTFTDDQPFDAQFLDQMSVHHEGAIVSPPR